MEAIIIIWNECVKNEKIMARNGMTIWIMKNGNNERKKDESEISKIIIWERIMKWQ